MPSAERRALLLLLGLAVAGHALRLWLLPDDSAPGAVTLLRTGSQGARIQPPGSPQAHRDSISALTRPLAPTERIDIEQASAAELARLPRVGLTLAKTIVADRQANGPFGSLEGLDRVPGIGPGLLRQIGPHVVFFGGAGRIASVGSTRGPAGLPSPAHTESATLSGVDATPDGRRRVRLNSASVNDLERLSGIGPKRARDILAYRERQGPYRSASDLAAVPGVSPILAQRVWALVDTTP